MSRSEKRYHQVPMSRAAEMLCPQAKKSRHPHQNEKAELAALPFDLAFISFGFNCGEGFIKPTLAFFVFDEVADGEQREI